MNRRRRLSGRGTVGKANKGGKEKEDGKAEERRREKKRKTRKEERLSNVIKCNAARRVPLLGTLPITS